MSALGAGIALGDTKTKAALDISDFEDWECSMLDRINSCFIKYKRSYKERGLIVPDPDTLHLGRREQFLVSSLEYSWFGPRREKGESYEEFQERSKISNKYMEEIRRKTKECIEVVGLKIKKLDVESALKISGEGTGHYFNYVNYSYAESKEEYFEHNREYFELLRENSRKYKEQK